MEIVQFTFSPFQENTYLLIDESAKCAIVDPGMYTNEERQELLEYITDHELTPVRLLNTHCHIDHVFGNQFIQKQFGLQVEAHQLEEQTLGYAQAAASMYELHGYEQSPPISNYLSEGTTVSFGSTQLEIRFTPGHAPGHIVFIHHDSKTVINGDVLFNGSIGRTDLPGGDFETLKQSIQTQLYTLPNDYTVYCGHGSPTTIGHEKQYNSFVREA